MTIDERRSSPSSLATVVATAAVTVALGITAAALRGDSHPRPSAARGAEVPSAQSMATAQQGVVLVPIAPDALEEQGAAGSADAPDTPFATYAEHDEDEGFDERQHGRREREHHEHGRDQHDDD